MTFAIHFSCPGRDLLLGPGGIPNLKRRRLEMLETTFSAFLAVWRGAYFRLPLKLGIWRQGMVWNPAAPGTAAASRTEGSVTGVHGRVIPRPISSITLGLDPTCITWGWSSSPPEGSWRPPTMLYTFCLEYPKSAFVDWTQGLSHSLSLGC